MLKRILIVPLFFLIISCSKAQSNDSLNAFSEKFKSDSLGSTGARASYVNKHNERHVILINGIDLNGHDKEWVMKYLGKPNASNDGNPNLQLQNIQQSFEYNIEQKDGGCKKLLILFGQQNKVDDVQVFYAAL